MARIEKYATGIVGVIKHNIREFKDGICPTNMEVDPKKIGENYSIIRCLYSSCRLSTRARTSLF